jgi:hypothetical protein
MMPMRDLRAEMLVEGLKNGNSESFSEFSAVIGVMLMLQ